MDGGHHNDSPVPASCATCHAVTRPNASYTAFNHTQPGPPNRNLPPIPAKMDRRLGCPDERHFDAPDWNDLEQDHRSSPHHRCRANRPDRRDLPWHETRAPRSSGTTMPIRGEECVDRHDTSQTETSARSLPRVTAAPATPRTARPPAVTGRLTRMWNASTNFLGGAWANPDRLLMNFNAGNVLTGGCRRT